jgi:dTDP-glucose 4,6-dehydratase
MKVLVSGSAGFFGTAFFQYLNRVYGDELDIYLFDKAYNQDIRNYEQLNEAMKGVDIYFHFAAMTHVDRSIPDPLPFFLTNSDGTVQALRAATENNVRMVYVSSSEVYGSADPEYMKTHDKMYEDHPLNPQSPYAAAKTAGDRAAYAWWKTYGTDIVTVRPFNLYGPYQAVEKAIPQFINRAVNGKSLPVYGKGEASRDWNFIYDTIRGVWLAGQHGEAGKAYNLATGKDYSLVELTEIIRSVLNAKGLTVHVSEVADRPGHVSRLIGGSYYAKEELGWEPKYDLERGIAVTADWLLSNGMIQSPAKVELRDPVDFDVKWTG